MVTQSSGGSHSRLHLRKYVLVLAVHHVPAHKRDVLGFREDVDPSAHIAAHLTAIILPVPESPPISS